MVFKITGVPCPFNCGQLSITWSFNIISWNKADLRDYKITLPFISTSNCYYLLWFFFHKYVIQGITYSESQRLCQWFLFRAQSILSIHCSFLDSNSSVLLLKFSPDISFCRLFLHGFLTSIFNIINMLF